ncbi:MAG: co-chaperone GroES [Clostridia bacterium]|nr:co-chaperone GroES [Clostridia bacterium]
MNIKPIFNRVLGKIIRPTRSKYCGIEIIQQEEVLKATVINMGETAKNCGVEINDTIFFEPHLVANIKINNEDFIIICVEDILAIEKIN